MPIYAMNDWRWVMECADEATLRRVDSIECASGLRAQYRLEEPQARLVTYTGRVLETREENGYDDSDFYALVWDGEKIAKEYYASTRGWTYGNGACVDATEDVQDAAEAWLAEEFFQCFTAEDAAEARTVQVGRLVRVARGRKVPQGTTGVVAWLGAGQWRARARLALDGGGEVWIDAANLDVVHPEALERPETELRNAARATAQRARRRGAWRPPAYVPRVGTLIAA
jgi:hypothetical protein